MTTTTQNTTHQIAPRRAMLFLQNETQGRIFSVYFKKKDGVMREMICRRGVTKHLRGGSLKYDPKAHRLLPVFDMVVKAYRMVNMETLVSFNVGGETFILA